MGATISYRIVDGATTEDVDFEIHPLTGRLYRLPTTGWITSHTIRVQARLERPGLPIQFAYAFVVIAFQDQQPPIVHISVGSSGPSCATNSQGKFWCWGQCQAGPSTYCPYEGEQNDLRIDNAILPDVAALPPVQTSDQAVQVVGLKRTGRADQASCLLTRSGNVRCWGSGSYLPYNSAADVPSPTSSPARPQYSQTMESAHGLSNRHNARVLQLYAGESSFCAVIDQTIMLNGVSLFSPTRASNIECWGSGGVVKTWFSRGTILVPSYPGQLARQSAQGAAVGANAVCWLGESRYDRSIRCYGSSVAGRSGSEPFLVTSWSPSGLYPFAIDASFDRYCVLYSRITLSPVEVQVYCFGTFTDPRRAMDKNISVSSLSPTTQRIPSFSSFYRGMVGTPVGIAVMRGGFCVAVDPQRAGSNHIYCSRAARETDSIGTTHDDTVDLFEATPPQNLIHAYSDMHLYENLANLQVTDINNPNQRVTSISAAGCSVCATIDGITGTGGDVRCFGCDGMGYQLDTGSVAQQGRLGYGPSVPTLGTTSPAYAYGPHDFNGATDFAARGQQPRIEFPAQRQVIQVDETNEMSVQIFERVQLSQIDPSSSGLVFELESKEAYSDNRHFRMNPITGALSTNGTWPFDYEWISQHRLDARYNLAMIVRDSVGVDTVEFTIEVQDAPEPPIFVTPIPAEVELGKVTESVGAHGTQSVFGIPASQATRTATGFSVELGLALRGANGNHGTVIVALMHSEGPSNGLQLSQVDVMITLQATSTTIEANVPPDATGELKGGEYTVFLRAADRNTGVEQDTWVKAEIMVPCKTGSIFGTSSGECSECPVGTAASADGTECILCDVDSYQPLAGQTQCIRCDSHLDAARWLKHSSPGQSTECPVCSEYAQAVTPERDQCLCRAGTYEVRPSESAVGPALQCNRAAALGTLGTPFTSFAEHSFPDLAAGEEFRLLEPRYGQSTTVQLFPVASGLTHTIRLVNLNHGAEQQGLGLAEAGANVASNEISDAQPGVRYNIVDVKSDEQPELNYWDLEPLQQAIRNSTEGGAMVPMSETGSALRVRVVVDDGIEGNPCEEGQELSIECSDSPASADFQIIITDIFDRPHYKLAGSTFTIRENQAGPPTASGDGLQWPEAPRANVAPDVQEGQLWTSGQQGRPSIFEKIPQFYDPAGPLAAVFSDLTFGGASSINFEELPIDSGTITSNRVVFESHFTINQGPPVPLGPGGPLALPPIPMPPLAPGAPPAPLPIGPAGETVTITIEFVDEQEAPVEVDVTGGPMSIEENKPAGTLVQGGTISVLDEDSGAMVKCQVTGAQAAFFQAAPVGIADADRFQQLTPASETNIAEVNVGAVGVWELRTAAALDHEDDALGLSADGSLDVTIKCTDNTGLSTTLDPRAVHVYNVNEMPQILGLEAGGTFTTLVENVPTGTEVGVFVASDPDAGDAGTLSFSLSGADAQSFTLVPLDAQSSSSGDNVHKASIRVAQGTSIDFETQSTYTITVTASDDSPGGIISERRRQLLEASTDISIQVLDVNEPPVISTEASTEYTVPENSQTGTVVTGQPQQASDPDAGDILTWGIVGGNGASHFAVDYLTGVITAIAGASLDFEDQNMPSPFEIVLRVADPGGLTDDRTITVAVQDVQEAPSISASDVQPVPENSEGRVTFATIKVSDPDAADTHLGLGPSPSPTPSVSASPSSTASVTPTASVSGSPSTSPTASVSGSPSTSPTASVSGSPSTSPTASVSGNPSTSPTASVSGSPSTSPTASVSGSPSTSPTASVSGSPSTSPTASVSGSPSTSPTASVSGSPSTSPTASVSGSPSTSPTASVSGSPSTSPTASVSGSPSTSPTASVSGSPSTSPTPSPSPSAAPAGTVVSSTKIAQGTGGLPDTFPQAGDALGRTAGVVGDMDGDGVDDLAVQVFISDPISVTNAGSFVLLFMKTDGTVKGYKEYWLGAGGHFIEGIGSTASSEFGQAPTRLDQPNGEDGHQPRLIVAQGIFNSGRGRAFIVRMDDQLEGASYTRLEPGYSGLPANTFGSGDRFGTSPSVLGDIDSDGLNDIAVGADNTADGVTQGGCVLIIMLTAQDTIKSFERISQATGGGLSGISPQLQFLSRGMAALPPRHVGHPVSLAVGAWGARSNAVVLLTVTSLGTVAPGSARVIADGQQGVPPGTLQRGSRIGFNVVNVGDLDGDGIQDIGVGAPRDSTGGASSGAVHLMFLAAGSESNAVKSVVVLRPTSPGLGGVVGAGAELVIVAAFADLSGDGRANLVLSGLKDDTGAMDAGALYVVSMGGPIPSSSPLPSRRLTRTTDGIEGVSVDCGSSKTQVSVELAEEQDTIVLQSIASLDFESFVSAECEVTVTDSAGLIASTSVPVAVTDVQESPVFYQEIFQYLLDENMHLHAPVNATGLAVAAFDPDAADASALVYTLTGPTAWRFHMDGTSAVVEYRGLGENFESFPLGMEYVDVGVSVTDSAGNTDNAIMRVWVADVNEAPVLVGPPTAEQAPRLITKDIGAGAAVSGSPLLTVDQDRSDQLHWYEVTGCSGQGCGAFGFHPETDPSIRLLRPELLDATVAAYEVSLTVRSRDRQDTTAGLFSGEGVVRVLVDCPTISCPDGYVAHGICGPNVQQQCIALDQTGPAPVDDNENAFIVQERAPASAEGPVAGLTLVQHTQHMGREGQGTQTSRDGDCGTELKLTWAVEAEPAEVGSGLSSAARLDAVRFFRLTGSTSSFMGEEPARAVIGLNGSTGGQTAVVYSPRLGLGDASSVIVEQVLVGDGCIDSSANPDNLLSLPESCFAPLKPLAGGSMLSIDPVDVSTRCFCSRCGVPPGAVATTYRNPACLADTYDAYMVPEEEWCLECSTCTSQQFETRACRGQHEGDEVDPGTDPASLDRQCQDCTVCGYDEFEVSSCGGDDGRTDRVCAPKLMESYPVRRKDGRTRRGRLFDGFSGQLRNALDQAEFEFRYSDNQISEGQQAWFRVDEIRRGNVRFAYVFKADNHREYRFILGKFPNQDLRFRLSYLHIDTRRGESMPTERPRDTDLRWRQSNTVELRAGSVETFKEATVVGGYPKRSVRATGSRGRIENAYDLQQRNESCHVIADVRYVCRDRGAGTECAEEQTFLVRETRRGNIRFGRTITMAADTEARLDLGTFPNQDVRFTLFHSDGSGGWRRSNDIDVRTGCAPTFEPLEVVGEQDSDRQTNRRGRLIPMYGEKRAANGDVLVFIDYFDEDGPAVDRFVVKETRRGNIRFAKEITLHNGERKLLNLGQFPNTDIRFGLFFENREGRGDWRQGHTIDVGTQRVETFQQALPLGPSTNTTRRTGLRGRIEGVYGERRAPGCSVHVRVRYWDEHRCDEDQRETFLVREVRRSNIQFARTVTLQNGQAMDLDLGTFSNTDLRFALFHEYPAGHWRVSNEIDIRTECANLFDEADNSDEADTIKGRGGRYDAYTGSRGRIFNVWNTRRAGSQSGLVTVDAQTGLETPVQGGDVVVRVAYSHIHGADPKRFLVQETRRSNIQFSKAITLQDGEEKWVNLGQFPNTDIRLGIFYWDRVRGWQLGREVDIGKEQVEDLSPAEEADGYAIENHRHTGSRARLETITGQNRLCDGSVAFRVLYCEDERYAPDSRTFVLRETRRSNVDFTVSIELNNCKETVVIVPASELTNQDLRFQLFDYDGQGGWDAYNPSYDIRTTRVDEVCPSHLDIPDADVAHVVTRRSLRATKDSGARQVQTLRSSLSAGGLGASARLMLPAAASIQVSIDPLQLGAEAAQAAAAVTSPGQGDLAQLMALRVGAQDSMRAALETTDPVLSSQVMLFVNLDAEERQLGLAVFPGHLEQDVVHALSEYTSNGGLASDLGLSRASVAAGRSSSGSGGNEGALVLVQESELTVDRAGAEAGSSASGAGNASPGARNDNSGAGTGGAPTSDGSSSGAAAPSSIELLTTSPALVAVVAGSVVVALAAMIVAALLVVRTPGRTTSPANPAAVRASEAGVLEEGSSLRSIARPLRGGNAEIGATDEEKEKEQTPVGIAEESSDGDDMVLASIDSDSESGSDEARVLPSVGMAGMT